MERFRKNAMELVPIVFTLEKLYVSLSKLKPILEKSIYYLFFY